MNLNREPFIWPPGIWGVINRFLMRCQIWGLLILGVGAWFAAGYGSVWPIIVALSIDVILWGWLSQPMP